MEEIIGYDIDEILEIMYLIKCPACKRTREDAKYMPTVACFCSDQVTVASRKYTRGLNVLLI